MACDPHLMQLHPPVKEGKRPRANGGTKIQMRDAASLPNLSQLSACARHVAATGGPAQSAQREVGETSELAILILEHLHNLSPEDAVEALKTFQKSISKEAFEKLKTENERHGYFVLNSFTKSDIHGNLEQTFDISLRIRNGTTQSAPASNAFSAREIIKVMNSQFPIPERYEESKLDEHIDNRIRFQVTKETVEFKASPYRPRFFSRVIRVELKETLTEAQRMNEGANGEIPLGKNLLLSLKNLIFPLTTTPTEAVRQKQDALTYALRDMFVKELGYVVLPNTDTDTDKLDKLVLHPLHPETPAYTSLTFKAVAWEDMLKISPPAGVSTEFDAFVKAWRALYLKT